MVTERKGATNYEVLKKKFQEYEVLLGRADFTLVRYTNTYNQNGRVSGYTTTTSTISGDLQTDSRLLKDYVDLGVAVKGNGIFYTEGLTAISANDEIIVNSITWKLTAKIEYEDIDGGQPYQGWIAVRKPDDA